MKRHTIDHIAFVMYITILAATSYLVTPWVWLTVLAGWSTDCGCEECQNIIKEDDNQ